MKKLLLILLAVMLVVPAFASVVRAENVEKTAEYEKGQTPVDLTFEHTLQSLSAENATDGVKVSMQGNFAMENGTNNFDVAVDNDRYTVEKEDPRSNVRFFTVKLKDGETFDGGSNDVTATVTVHVDPNEETTGISVEENGNFTAGWKIRENNKNGTGETVECEYVVFTVTAVEPQEPEQELTVDPEGSAAGKLTVDPKTVELSSEDYTEALVVITADPADPKNADAKLAFRITAQITLKDASGETISSADVVVKSIRIVLDVSEAFKAGDKVTICHYAEDGTLKEKIEGVTVDENGKVTFTNTKGFSTFEISAYTEPQTQPETQPETKPAETPQPAKPSNRKVVNTAGK